MRSGFFVSLTFVIFVVRLISSTRLGEVELIIGTSLLFIAAELSEIYPVFDTYLFGCHGFPDGFLYSLAMDLILEAVA